VKIIVPALICFAMAVAPVYARLLPLTPEQQSAAEQKRRKRPRRRALNRKP
jgi:hypothetical protein